MRRCVYTVVTGSYDGLRPCPPADGWDCLVFTDNPRLESTYWKTVLFDARGLDPLRASRLPKILPHRFLADYDYSLYLDANLRLRSRPTEICKRAGWPDFANVKHPWRDCVYQELEQIAALDKAPRIQAKAEADRYRAAGVPTRGGLYENGFLLRRHNEPAVMELDEAWWESYLQAETGRDQPALAVTLWRRRQTVMTLSATERSRHVHRRPHRKPEES